MCTVVSCGVVIEEEVVGHSVVEGSTQVLIDLQGELLQMPHMIASHHLTCIQYWRGESARVVDARESCHKS